MKKNQGFAPGEVQGKMLQPLLSADEAGPRKQSPCPGKQSPHPGKQGLHSGKQGLHPSTTSRGLQKNQTGPMDSLEDGQG